MKSESTKYQPRTDMEKEMNTPKPDLLQSIASLQKRIEENAALAEKHHKEAVAGRAKLRKLLALSKEYDDIIAGVSESIIADEASGFNGEKV